MLFRSVYTFEFHELRARETKAGLESLMSHEPGGFNVTVTHADACADGFCKPSDGADLRGAADGVFLDLPSPWSAVGHALQVLRPGGAFCAFSPCIEQVQRTCAELALGNRFHSLRTIEILERPYDAKRVILPRVDDVLLLDGKPNAAGPPASKRKREETQGDAEGVSTEQRQIGRAHV